MNLFSILAIVLLGYFMWQYLGKVFVKLFPKLSFVQKRQNQVLKNQILLLLRGNEEAFQRMYKREKASHPDLNEGDILERMREKLSYDR